jgi:hypothetical protein
MAAISNCIFANWEFAHACFNESYDYGPDDFYSKIISAFCILHELELTDYQNHRLTFLTYDASIDAIHEYMKIDKTNLGYTEKRLQAFLLICLLITTMEAIPNHLNLYSYLTDFVYPGYKKKINDIYIEINSLVVDFINKSNLYDRNQQLISL